VSTARGAMTVPEQAPSNPLSSRTLTSTTDVVARLEHADPFTMAVPIAPHAPPGIDGAGIVGNTGDVGARGPLVPPQLERMSGASVIAATTAAARQVEVLIEAGVRGTVISASCQKCASIRALEISDDCALGLAGLSAQPRPSVIDFRRRA